MSKMGRYAHGLQEDAAHYWGAMDRARGKALSDFTEEQVNQMVWSARYWLRGYPTRNPLYLEQVLLTEDARAEITRRAMEAEQTADRKEIEQ